MLLSNWIVKSFKNSKWLSRYFSIHFRSAFLPFLHNGASSFCFLLSLCGATPDNSFQTLKLHRLKRHTVPVRSGLSVSGSCRLAWKASAPTIDSPSPRVLLQIADDVDIALCMPCFKMIERCYELWSSFLGFFPKLVKGVDIFPSAIAFL